MFQTTNQDGSRPGTVHAHPMAPQDVPQGGAGHSQGAETHHLRCNPFSEVQNHCANHLEIIITYIHIFIHIHQYSMTPMKMV